MIYMLRKMSVLFVVLLFFQTEMRSDELLHTKQNYSQELQSIAGALVASNLYSSYVSVDLLGQKISGKDFDFKRDKKILSSLEMIASGIDEVLKTLYSITESKKDAKVIYDLVELCKKVKGDAELLLEFAKNRKTEILEDYNKHHLQTWNDMNRYFSGKRK